MYTLVCASLCVLGLRTGARSTWGNVQIHTRTERDGDGARGRDRTHAHKHQTPIRMRVRRARILMSGRSTVAAAAAAAGGLLGSRVAAAVHRSSRLLCRAVPCKVSHSHARARTAWQQDTRQNK